jgi:ABC-type molybdate transport system substrate-binding protein
VSDDEVRGPLPPPDGPSRRIGPYEQSLRDQSKQVARAVARRAARRRRTRIIGGVLALAVLGGGAYGAMKWFGGTESPSFTSSTSAVPTHCANPSTVTVAVPAAMGPALTEVTAALADREDGPCTTFELSSVDAAVTYRTLGTAARPQAWVTDSSIWVAEANAAGSKLEAADPFATSAIVVAMSPDRAKAFKFAPKWADLATGTDAVRFPDPSRSTVGLLSLAAVGSGVSAQGLDTIVSAAAKAPASTVEPASLAKAGTSLAVPVPESALIEYNRENPANSLAAVAPQDGTAPLEYSLVSTTDDEKSVASIKALSAYLRSDAAKEILADHGFRVPGATAPTAAEPLVGSIKMVAQPTPQVIAQVRKVWSAATPQRQVLVALDVSGSMLSRTDRGTRLALAQDAIRVSMASLPETARTAFWVYSNHIGQRDDFLPLTGFGTMSDAKHRAALEKGIAGLDKTVGGGRGLYDSILASYQSAQGSFAAGRANSVVIVVDGPNEDDYGLDFRRLRIELTTKKDAARPVRLVFVGIGSKPPVAALTELTQITGGAYIAVEKPEDLGRALVQAVTGS